MGLFSGVQTIKIDYVGLADIFERTFLVPQYSSMWNDLLTSLNKTFFGCKMDTADGKYTFYMSSVNIKMAPFVKRYIWIRYNENKVVYELDKKNLFKDFQNEAKRRLINYQTGASMPNNGNMSYNGMPNNGNMGYNGMPNNGNMGYNGMPNNGNMGYNGMPNNGNMGYNNMPNNGNMGYNNMPNNGNMGYNNMPNNGNMGYNGMPNNGNMGYNNVPNNVNMPNNNMPNSASENTGDKGGENK